MIYGSMKIRIDFSFFDFFLFLFFLRFATWIQHLAVDHVYPEYDIWTQFVSDVLATCMIPDALYNSHPIEMPIKKPTEINEIFDDITYEKGSVLFVSNDCTSRSMLAFRFQCHPSSSCVHRQRSISYGFSKLSR